MRTLLTQSRIASLIASLRVRLPEVTGAYLCPHQLHAVDVGRLPSYIFFAHVDNTFESQHGANGGHSDPMLAGARLGDNPGLAHALGQQSLSQGVVNFMGAGMGQVFALQQNSRPARFR